jgi:hypothetical protein
MLADAQYANKFIAGRLHKLPGNILGKALSRDETLGTRVRVALIVGETLSDRLSENGHL